MHDNDSIVLGQLFYQSFEYRNWFFRILELCGYFHLIYYSLNKISLQISVYFYLQLKNYVMGKTGIPRKNNEHVTEKPNHIMVYDVHFIP